MPPNLPILLSSLDQSGEEEDAPYVPPVDSALAKDTNMLLAPAGLVRPESPFQEPFVFRHSTPMDSPQTLSPLELAPSLPPSPAFHASSLARSSRRTKLDMANLYTMDSDSEMESGDDASEDEYVPSPRIRARELGPSRGTTHSRVGRAKTRTVPRHSYSPYPPSSASSSAADPSSSNARRPGSRNVQLDEAPPLRGTWARNGPDAYKCPYCDHVQLNKRSPDLERHIRSHFRRTTRQRWVCCGLPLDEAAKQDISADNNRWEFNGRTMVGGCHQDFSRMDALKRHIDNKNNPCKGNTKWAKRED